MDEYADRVWNRAAMENGGSDPRPGDQHLSALLRAHGLICNGGVLHCLEVLTADEMQAAIEGYRYFGMNEVASFLSAETLAIGSEWTDEDELRLDTEYSGLVPQDAILDDKLRRRLQGSPADFAPA